MMKLTRLQVHNDKFQLSLTNPRDAASRAQCCKHRCKPVRPLLGTDVYPHMPILYVHTRASCTKTRKPIEMPFGAGADRVGPRTHVLDGVMIGQIDLQPRGVTRRRCGLLPNYWGHSLYLAVGHGREVLRSLCLCVSLYVCLFAIASLNCERAARSAILDWLISA